MSVLRRRGGDAVAAAPGEERAFLTPGLRLVAVPALLVLGICVCSALPDGRRQQARAVAGICIALTVGVLAGVASLILPSGRVDHSFGQLVTGIDLTLRAESSGLVILLLAAAFALIALLEGARKPAEHAALLLCLLGTALAALAGNAVLLFGGLELGNVGAVLLSTAGGERASWRDRNGFIFQHVAALGLLLAALRLQNQFQTADLASLPPGALGSAVALAWAAAGVARLVAAPGLAGSRGASSSSAWTAVAAVPTGLIVLLRLLQVGGGDLPTGVGPALTVAGLLLAAAGAFEAWRNVTRPAAAGRALCTAMAGPVVFSAGISGGRGLGVFAATGLALCLALAMAPAWGGGGRIAAGNAARWVRALALALIAGVPAGYGAVALLLTAGAVATLGHLGAPAMIAFGVLTILIVAAGTAAARAALSVPDPATARGRLRADAAVAVALGVVAGVVPGLIQTTFVRGVVGDPASSASAVDWLALRGAGGAWPAGYLTLGVLVCGAMVASVAVLLERCTVAIESMPVVEAPERSRLMRATRRVVAAAPERIQQKLRWFDWLDQALVGQPGLAAILAGAFGLLWVFR